MISLGFIGESHVGKTTLLKKLLNEKNPAKHSFDENETYQSTIGLDCGFYNDFIGNDQLQITLFDTAGQEKFHSITRSYFNKLAGIIIVFDVTQRKSYEQVIEKWYSDVMDYVMNPARCILLIGNKIDLINDRQVSYDEAYLFAKNHQIMYLETSAKKTKIQHTINELTFTIYQKIKIAENARKAHQTSDFFVVKIDQEIQSKQEDECCV